MPQPIDITLDRLAIIVICVIVFPVRLLVRRGTWSDPGDQREADGAGADGGTAHARLLGTQGSECVS